MELDILKGKKVAELREIAAALKIEGAAKMKKAELLDVFTRMHEEAVASGAVEETEKEAEPADKEQDAKTGEGTTPEAPEEAKPAKKRGRSCVKPARPPGTYRRN